MACIACCTSPLVRRKRVAKPIKEYFTADSRPTGRANRPSNTARSFSTPLAMKISLIASSHAAGNSGPTTLLSRSIRIPPHRTKHLDGILYSESDMPRSPQCHLLSFPLAEPWMSQQRRFRSLERALASRDMTVPVGHSRMAPISR